MPTALVVEDVPKSLTVPGQLLVREPTVRAADSGRDILAICLSALGAEAVATKKASVRRFRAPSA